MAHNKMSPCDAIEARLTDFPDLRDETRIELERHAETCQSCRAKLAEYRALMAALRNFEALFEELETRVRRLPDVVSAGFVTMLPLTASGGAIYFGIEDGLLDPGLEPAALFRSVSDDYFRTMGIPLRGGRVFDVRDRLGAPAVVIVNETLARRYFPEGDALGHHLSVWGESSEIAGIVGDVQQLELGADTRPAIYVASPQRALGYFDPKDLAVCTTAEPEALAASIRAEIWELDPDQPIASVRTMNDIVLSSVTDERLQTSLLSVFGLVALSLAAIGVYGVQSYSVSSRTGEIGLRMALGAQAGDVLGTVTVHGMTRAILGILLGVMGAVWSTRFLTGMLYGVAPSDPWTLLAISVALGGVAFGACLLPGLRATRIDPLIALRDS